MAIVMATQYRPYRSKPAQSATAPTWVQFDLGSASTIEAIRLYPSFDMMSWSFKGSPARLKIEASNDADMRGGALLLDHTREELPDPGDRTMVLAIRGAAAQYRYVRLTATELGTPAVRSTCFRWVRSRCSPVAGTWPREGRRPPMRNMEIRAI